jgi:hypothetical protein
MGTILCYTIILANVDNILAFYNPKVRYHVHKTVSLLSTSIRMNPASTTGTSTVLYI